jgi:hypothetical protein
VERLLIVGLDEPEYLAIREKVALPTTWSEMLPRLQLRRGLLHVESPRADGRFLPVSRVVFHGIFEAVSGRDWRRERAGNLRSLNQLAVSVALRLWEDFVAERVTASTWAHVEFDPAGRLSVVYPAFTSAAHCPLCPVLAYRPTAPRAGWQAADHTLE